MNAYRNRVNWALGQDIWCDNNCLDDRGIDAKRIIEDAATAAPDLLEACKNTVSFLKSTPDKTTIEEDFVNYLRQAIAKAEG